MIPQMTFGERVFVAVFKHIPSSWIPALIGGFLGICVWLVCTVMIFAVFMDTSIIWTWWSRGWLVFWFSVLAWMCHTGANAKDENGE
jgi:hypothetical protein